MLVGLLGVAIERLLFRRFYRSDPILSLLLTFGLAMVAEQALRMIFGAPPLPLRDPAGAARPDLHRRLHLFRTTALLMLAVAVGCVAADWLLLHRTPFGRVVRAGVQNPDMVGALGISLEPYMAAIAALGVGLAGLAGVLLAPISRSIRPWAPEILTAAFVVVVIGGLGSFWGVVRPPCWSASCAGSWWRSATPPASEAAMYLLMVLVLLFRPRGLFGERIQRFE